MVKINIHEKFLSLRSLSRSLLQHFMLVTLSMFVLSGCGGGGGDSPATTPSGISTAPTISTATPQAGTVGVVYSYTYAAAGSTPITFSVTSGVLPNGLSLSASGVISGIPTLAGTYTGIVTASNGTQPDATQNFSITVVTLTSPTPSANNANPLVYVANSGGANTSINDTAANTVTNDVYTFDEA